MAKAMTFVPAVVEDASGREFCSVEHGTVHTGQVKQQIIDQHNSDPEAIIGTYVDSDDNEIGSYVEYTDDDLDGLMDSVGGEENYEAMLQWASRALSQEDISEYDAVMESEDINEISRYVHQLAGLYQNRNSESNDEFINESFGRQAYNELMEIVDEEFDEETREIVDAAFASRDLQEIMEVVQAVMEAHAEDD